MDMFEQEKTFNELSRLVQETQKEQGLYAQGVYIIYDEKIDTPTYIGYSQNIHKRIILDMLLGNETHILPDAYSIIDIYYYKFSSDKTSEDKKFLMAAKNELVKSDQPIQNNPQNFKRKELTPTHEDVSKKWLKIERYKVASRLLKNIVSQALGQIEIVEKIQLYINKTAYEEDSIFNQKAVDFIQDVQEEVTEENAHMLLLLENLHATNALRAFNRKVTY